MATAVMLHPLPRFYPSDRLTLPYTIVDSGISLSHVVAAPLAAGCLSLTGLGGLQGWQWLFLLEGAPTLVLALVMLRRLPNSPEKGGWLLSTSDMSWLFCADGLPLCVFPSYIISPLLTAARACLLGIASGGPEGTPWIPDEGAASQRQRQHVDLAAQAG